MRTDLKLFSRAWCGWCIEAKEYLKRRGYRFHEVDIGHDRAAYEEMLEISDQPYVPTLLAGEKVLADFDVEQLEQFLRAHDIVP